MKKILIIIMCWVLAGQVHAQHYEELITSMSGSLGKRITSNSLGAANRLMIQSEEYGPIVSGTASGFSLVDYNARVVLRYDENLFKDISFYNSDFRIRVTYNLYTYDEYNTKTEHTNQALEIFYSKTSQTQYTDEAMKVYTDALRADLFVTKVEVCTTSTTCSLATVTTLPVEYNDVYLDLVQETKLCYDDPGAPRVSFCATSTPGEMGIAWGSLVGAQSYDFEWLFIDVPEDPSTAAVDYDFYNATRINTTKNYYHVPLAYPSGIILFRVRSVYITGCGTPDEKIAYSDWSDYNTNTGNTSSATTARYNWGGLEPEMNWSYTMSFAEEGKYKNAIGFFDGLMRSRQTVSEINTLDDVIVAETIYDHIGRPVVQTLPVPYTTNFNGIRYYNNFNQDFNAANFDLDDLMENPEPLNTAAIASQYYSTNSDYKSTDPYLPVANGYAYTQTRYKNDGTERVSKQAGPGLAHMMGSGHETEIVYGTAVGRELDELFGNEVSYPGRYQKILTKDAQGQVSVSYLDQEGRTVAAGLTGSAAPGLVPIDVPEVMPSKTANLLNGDSSTVTGTVATYSKTIVTAGGDHYFTYTLNPQDFDHDCYPLVNCLYKVTISIANQYGDNVTLAPGSPHCNGGGTCTSSNYELTANNEIVFSAVTDCDVDFTATLPFGSYTITKTVELDEAAMAGYSQDFFDTYINEQPTEGCYIYPVIEPAPCETDCETGCAAAYAWNAYNETLEDSVYIDENGVELTETERLELIETCILHCSSIVMSEQPSTCEMKYTLMQQDMSPGGQYFDNQAYSFSYAGPGYTTIPVNDSWLQAHVHAQGSGHETWFETTFGTGIENWGDVRDNWDESFLFIPLSSTISGCDSLIACHPEFCLYVMECVAKPCPGFIPDHIDVMEQSNEMDFIMLQPALYLPSGVSYDNYMNPLNITQVNTQDPDATDEGDTDYWPYANVTDDPYFPENGCFVEVCGEESDREYMLRHLQNYLPLGYSTPDLYFSIWYVINDPDSIHNSTTPVGNISPVTMQVFYMLHGNPITGEPGLIDDTPDAAGELTRQQFFAQQYVALKKFVQHLVVEQSSCDYLVEDDAFPGEHRTSAGFKIRFFEHSLYDGVDCENYGSLSSNVGIPEDPAPDADQVIACESLCAVSVQDWMDQIFEQCPGLELTSTQEELIEQYLLEVCKASCQNDATPLGSSSCGDCNNVVYEDDEEVEHVFTSFEDVINYFTGEFIDETPALCAVTICHPLSDHDNTACICAGLNDYISDNSLTTNAEIVGSVLSHFGVVVTEDQVQAWKDECMATCPSELNLGVYAFPEALITAATAASSGTECVCANLTGWFGYFGFDDPNDAGQLEAFADSLAIALDTAVNETDVAVWFTECSSLCRKMTVFTGAHVPYELRCNESPLDPVAACNTLNQTVAENAEYAQWYNTIYTAQQEFEQQNASTCLSDVQSREEFAMQYQEYASMITLYYYDQAGNMIKTVPPKGVQRITASGDFDDIDAYRANPLVNAAQYTVPAHTYVSKYKFNTLEQVVEQTTPDGGTTVFFYDSKGRVAASKSARQAAFGTPGYSYTLYDEQGRPYESGEALSSTTLTEAMTLDLDIPSAFETWLGTASKREITTTFYDEQPGSGLANPFGSAPRQLRNRVAGITYDENGDGTYESAQHYLYDIHGNVKELYNENALLADIGQDKKHFEYVYDLVSGNVHEVHYQDGEFDQLHHQYLYDADNRLWRALSSTNGRIYRTEAKYFYYAHGPLKRVEVGAHQVAGSDYAYTLQGWLRHMNSSVLNIGNDMGADSRLDLNNLNAVFAKDAHAYSLGYFKPYTANNAALLNSYFGGTTPVVKDYEDIGAAANAPGIYMDPGTHIFGSRIRSLYNGNIAYTTRDIMTGVSSGAPTYLDINLSQYTYDQAQRLKASVYYTDGGARNSNEINPATDIPGTRDYQMNLVYDFNGNIDTLSRYGTSAGGQMDTLVYHYTVNTNKLEYVEDGVSSGTYTVDVDDQSSGNYTYDASGNLITDYAEHIALIEWNAKGKVTKIIRAHVGGTEDLEFKYNPLGQRIAKIVKPRDVSGNLYGEAEWRYTFYQLDAQGNTMATYEKTYEHVTGTSYTASYKLNEQYLYGSERLGSRTPASTDGFELPFTATLGTPADPDDEELFTDVDYGLILPEAYQVDNYDAEEKAFSYIYTMGQRHYEQKDHLGNVVATISDRRIAVDQYNYTTGTTHVASTVINTVDPTRPAYVYVGTGGTKAFALGTDDMADSWMPEVETYSDYYPFGALMPGRNTNAGSYRHGYQGQECDPEISGEGNSYAFEYRFHDPRLGRFLSIDPLAASFAYNSPYAFSENKVMHCIELEGLEAWPVNGEAKDLMSQEGWQNFNHAEVQRLTAPEVQDRMKFDCVDFVVHMWVSYYQSEGVAMPMIKAGGITIDFYDPKYKDKPELFMRDMKRAIGGNIDDLFMKRIPTSEATFGDVIYQPDVHASMVYNDEKLLSDYRANLSSLGMDPNIKIYGYAQGSGYDTEGYGTAPGLDPLEVKVDWGNYWAPTYRLNFVRELPRTEQMETVNSIKVTSLKIQNGTTAAETSR